MGSLRPLYCCPFSCQLGLYRVLTLGLLPLLCFSGQNWGLVCAHRLQHSDVEESRVGSEMGHPPMCTRGTHWGETLVRPKTACILFSPRGGVQVAWRGDTGHHHHSHPVTASLLPTSCHRSPSGTGISQNPLERHWLCCSAVGQPRLTAVVRGVQGSSSPCHPVWDSPLCSSLCMF